MALKIQGKRLDPRTDSPDARPLPRRKAPGRPAFVLGHLPKRWDWDDAVGRFLPQISTISFSPGVQGCRALRTDAEGREQLDTSAVRAHFQQRGGVIIEPSDTRLGPYRAYQQKVENDAKAEVNFSIFESFDVIGDDVWWDHNAEEFRKFRLLLLDEEIVPDIHPRVRSRAIENQERIVGDLQRRYGANPSHGGLRTELDHAIGRLRAMRDGIPTADALALVRAEEAQAKREAEAVPVDAPHAAPAPHRPRGRPPGRKSAQAPADEGSTP